LGVTYRLRIGYLESNKSVAKGKVLMAQAIVLFIIAILTGLLAGTLAVNGIQGWQWLLVITVLCILSCIYSFLLLVVEALTVGRDRQ
jgi:MFS family permease